MALYKYADSPAVPGNGPAAAAVPTCHGAVPADGLCVPCGLRAGLVEELPEPALTDQFFPAQTQAGTVPALGQRVGDYELREEIARGGMGIVYRARQRAPDRIVALKMILPAALDAPGALERFGAEAAAAASLDHPCILPIYEVGERGGLPYFSMKLAENGSLAARLPWRPERAVRAGVELMTRLARALHFAHQRGILHRDLKPGNVLFDAADRPYVSDFGLARSLGGDGVDLAQTQFFAGTPSYMAPEQAAGGERLTTAADVYALGAILYELLGGRPPFVGNSVLDVLRQVAERPPRPLRALDPGLPRDLESICQRCLEKAPGARYASAEALADDLDRWLEGRPTRARPVGPGARLWRWAGRKPALAAVSGTLAALTVASAVGLTFFSLGLARERDRARQSERGATEKLRESLYAQAHALRRGTQAGRRFESLRALAAAARLRPGLELRNEAAAALALADVEPERRWPGVRASVDTPVAFDTALERYAVPDTGGTVRVRRLRDNAELTRLRGPEPGVDSHLVFSPDGAFLAGRYPGGEILLWRLPPGPEGSPGEGSPPILSVRGPETLTEPAFSPDGRRLVCADAGGGLVFYDLLASPVPVPFARWEDVPSVRGLCFSPGGERLALTSRPLAVAQIREVATGRLLVSLPHPAGVTLVAWSADGQRLATGCWDANVYLWDADDGRLLRTLERHTNIPIRPRFHPGGTLLTTAGWDAVLRFWDAGTGRHLFDGPACYDWQRFSPDGRRLAVADYDGSVGVYRVADGDTLRLLRPRDPERGESVGLDFSPDGRLLAVPNLRGVRVWRVGPDDDGPRELPLLPLPGIGFVTPKFSTDGSALLASRDSAGVFRWPRSGPEAAGVPTFGAPECLRAEPGWQVVERLADGRIGLVQEERGMVRLGWPDGGVAPAVEFGPHPGVQNLSVSPDGRWAATGAWHGRDVRVWETATGRGLATLPVGENTQAVFLPDGRLLSVTFGEAALWREADGGARWQVERRWHPEVGKQFWMGAAASPDGRLLALPQSGDLLRLVDTATGEECVTLEAPETLGLSRARFSADGRFLAVLGARETVGLWDLPLLRRQLAEVGLDW